MAEESRYIAPEADMSRRMISRYRLMCLLIILFMLVMGMHVNEVHMDSPLAYPAFSNASFQKVSMGQEAVAYRDNSVLSQLENVTVLRTSTRSVVGTRLAQWLVFLFLPTVILLKFLIWEKSVFLYRTCDNQYRHRTLKYIHQTDGKKA